MNYTLLILNDMAEVYNDILKGQIGRVTAKAKADNYFPVIGEAVRIDAETRWGQTSEWQTKDSVGGDVVTSAGNLTMQKDSKSVVIAGAGELRQKFIAGNKLFSTEVLKTVYAMQPQALPYFQVKADEVIRVGEPGSIRITPDNGYLAPLSHATLVRIYRENETVSPVKTLTGITGRPGVDGTISFSLSFDSVSDRGIYDIEVDVTDETSGVTFTQRHNKLITVTPALCPKPADMGTGYEVVATYNSITSYSEGKWLTFEVRLWRNVNDTGLNYAEAILPHGSDGYAQYDFIPVQDLPAGTTLCLKLDPKETEAYPFRMFVQGGKLSTATSENGTPNFTHASPLVITHDNADIWEWRWTSYGSMQFNNNCRNIVLDGRGYNDTGIHFTVDNEHFYDSCIFLGGGLSDFEIFGCDIDGAGFAGISAKSDPSPGQPWYWRENGFEFKNLLIHHCTFRNTYGEGIYLGYFGTGRLGSEGNYYHAHILRNPRVYRCEFNHNGFDSVQITNARGVEVCYCDIIGSAYRREVNQASAFSLGMDGKIYNCRVLNNNGDIGFINPFMSGIEMYNNVLISGRGNVGIRLTYWTAQDNEYIDPDEDGNDSTLSFDFHNNVLKAANIGVLNGDITFSNFAMNDNIFITENGDTATPGYFTGTGNIFLRADRDYETIDAALKVADAANDNYQPAHNSIAVTAGRAGKALFDFRGYKNWFANVHRAGPFMGKYKDPDVVDAGIALDRVTLADGSTSTLSQTVSVQLSYRGDVSQYKIGETADLSTVAWTDFPSFGVIEYLLSDGFGAKTVYVQVSDGTTDSNILSSSIIYQATPLSLDSITAKVSGKLKVDIVFNYQGSYIPTKYRIGEMADLSAVAWMDHSDNIQYTFTSAGEKTLYGQLQDSEGGISEIRSTTVTVSDIGRKAVLSLGWINFIDNSVFDENLLINKMLFVGHTGADVWRWKDGSEGGTIRNGTQKCAGIKSYPAAKGATTGDDSGIYPDEIMEKAALVRAGFNSEWTYEEAVLALPAGSYKIRLFNSTTATLATTTNFCKYQLVVNDVEYDYEFPQDYDVRNNLTQWIEQTVTVEAGSVKLRWGVLPVNTWSFCPLNMIEIEEV